MKNPCNLICRDFVIPEESLSCFMWRRFQRDKLYVQELLYPSFSFRRNLLIREIDASSVTNLVVLQRSFFIPEESVSGLLWRRFQRDKLYVQELLYPVFVIPQESQRGCMCNASSVTNGVVTNFAGDFCHSGGISKCQFKN